MSETGNEVNPRRTAAWLELKDAGMSQKKIGMLLGLSQSTVNRALQIAEGLRDGPYTADMNQGIDGYIVRRDAERAELKRDQQKKAERAAAEEARREKAAARERLRAWVDDELTLSEQDSILGRYRLNQRSRGEPRTPVDELDELVRHLKGLEEPPSPQVQKERAPVGQRKSVVVRPAAGPVAATSAATPNAEPSRQTTSSPVQRNAEPPPQPLSPLVRSKRQVSSHSTNSPNWVDVGKVALVGGVVLAALMAMVGMVNLASNDTVKEVWSVVTDDAPYWGPILGLLSFPYMLLPVGKDDPAAGTLWTMKILMLPVLAVSGFCVLSWLYKANGVDVIKFVSEL